MTGSKSRSLIVNRSMALKRTPTSWEYFTKRFIFVALFCLPSIATGANANLFVSAENPEFDNYMSGPQVIEVVVIDSDINDTDEAKGEPDVTVNGDILRMVQADDGNWYGYFADRAMAQIADSTTEHLSSAGLDFGTFCSGASASAVTGVDLNDTDGVAVPSNSGSEGSPTGEPITTVCGSAGSFFPNNVVREARSPSSFNDGQIGINTANWPFMQLYDLNPTGNVVIEYNKGGNVQTTTLTFDTVEQFASLGLDRASYPPGSEVHATLTDLWLNIDPTDEDSWTFGTGETPSIHYQVFDENGAAVGDTPNNTDEDLTLALDDLMCEDNCRLGLDPDAQGIGFVVSLRDNDDSAITDGNSNDTDDPTGWQTVGGNLIGQVPITFTEQGPNSGVFGVYDESDKSNIVVISTAARGTSASINYNEDPMTVVAGFSFATIDIIPQDDEWNSGEEIPVQLVDNDLNKNSRADEDLDLFNPEVEALPSLITGDPFTLAENNEEDEASLVGLLGNTMANDLSTLTGAVPADNINVEAVSKRAIIQASSTASVNTLIIDLDANVEDLRASIHHPAHGFRGFNFLNIDVRSITSSPINVLLLDGPEGIINATMDALEDCVTATTLVTNTDPQSLTSLLEIQDNLFSINPTNRIGLMITFPETSLSIEAIAVDFFSFGFFNDGELASERVANQIIRLELEETGDNTGTFEGNLEFTMLNQLNILDPSTYEDMTPIADDPTFIVIEDLTDEDAPRVNYLDIGADGVPSTIADQEEAPSHSGIVSFDRNTYGIGDNVFVTLEDQDLNVDSDLIEIYTAVDPIAGDPAGGTVGAKGLPVLSFGPLGGLLWVEFDDQPWISDAACGDGIEGEDGLASTGFTLIETDSDSGVFVADFHIPSKYCNPASRLIESTLGVDIEVNYVDFRDASGEIIEVGDSAGIRANTGSVSLDRTVYPVPFGMPDDFDLSSETVPSGRSLFPIHQTGMGGIGIPNNTSGLDPGEFLSEGALTVHLRVNDPDFDLSPTGVDLIAQNVEGSEVGPVKISVIRGAQEVVLGYAGGPTATNGRIDVNDDDPANARQFGPIQEIAPDAGIFEFDLIIAYTDGPASALCPATMRFGNLDGGPAPDELSRFDASTVDLENYCILQGDIIQVEYTDPTDVSGEVKTVTDSATFDLRNGVLQSDKTVYIIGSDMILTLIEPDFDLDNDAPEIYTLDIIQWDSDAATVTMGEADGEGATFGTAIFRETGDSTGIFQTVIKIPEELGGDRIERGEEIILEYTDWGPSGSDYVGQEDEDVNLTIFTSNAGATVELDQKVYSWTDKVFITIVAPEHNVDSDLVDEIGSSDLDPVKISTRGFDLDNYKLVETGTDTGIFTGEVVLTGFLHDTDGDQLTGDTNGFDTNPRTEGNGPTDGFLEAQDDDGITVSFEFAEDELVVGSALISWNIGEVHWLEASYPASGTGVVRVIDPDMNLDPEAIDNFDVDVWSDSDAGGIDLTVTETNEATGIFEGTVFFTVTDESSGNRLRVAEGDTVTAEYEDHTLPDPFTPIDELAITATAFIDSSMPLRDSEPDNNLDLQVTSLSEKSQSAYALPMVKTPRTQMLKSATAFPAVEGVVWIDINGDGVQGINENGIEGIEIQLIQLDEKAQPRCDFRRTNTSAEGRGTYTFNDIPPGFYYIEIPRITGFNLSPQSQGEDDGVDSDVDPVSRQSPIMTLLKNQSISLDIGLVPLINSFPSVKIVAPQSGQSLTALGEAMVSIKANAVDEDGSISGVAFFREICEFTEGQLRCIRSDPLPGQVSQNNNDFMLQTVLTSGRHVITAVATDNIGAETASNPVGITVSPFNFVFFRPGGGINETVAESDRFTFVWAIPADLRMPESRFQFDLYLFDEPMLSQEQIDQGLAVKLNDISLDSSSPQDGFRFTADPAEGKILPIREGEDQTTWYPHVLICGDEGDRGTGSICSSTFRNIIVSGSQTLTVLQADQREVVTVNLILGKGQIFYGEFQSIQGELLDEEGLPIEGMKPVIIQVTDPDDKRSNTLALMKNGMIRIPQGLAPDRIGPWKVKIIWEGNSVYQPAESNEVMFEVMPGAAALELVNLGAPHRPDENLRITGKLSLVNGNPAGLTLEGIPISFVLTEPSSAVPIDVPGTSTDEDGNFQMEIEANTLFVDREGDWTLQARTSDNRVDRFITHAVSKAHLLPIRGSRGYAILVQGAVGSGEGVDEHLNTVQFVNDVFEKSGKFRNDSSQPEDDDIFEIFVDPDAAGREGSDFKEKLREGIQDWAKDKMLANPAPLYVVLVNHGELNGEEDAGMFHLHPDNLRPEELDEMLFELENNFPENSLVIEEPIIVVLGMCFSGSFMEALSRPGRIIISASASNERSIQGPAIDPAPERRLQQGEYFVYLLFRELSTGVNLLDGFNVSRNMIRQVTSRFNLAKQGTESQFPDADMGQHPLMDDNGDGVASQLASLTQGDGLRAAKVVLRASDVSEGLRNSFRPDPDGIPKIARVSPSIFLGPDTVFPDPSTNNDTLILWAEVDETPTSKNNFPLFLEIKKPGNFRENAKNDETLQADLAEELDCRPMAFDNDFFGQGGNTIRYIWPEIESPNPETIITSSAADDSSNKFSEPGVYEIIFNAIANSTAELQPSTPITTFVYRARDTKSLGAVTLRSPPSGTVVDFINECEEGINDCEAFINNRMGLFTWDAIDSKRNDDDNDGDDDDDQKDKDDKNTNDQIRYIFRLWLDDSKSELVLESRPLDEPSFVLAPNQVINREYWWDVVAVDHKGRHSETRTNETRQFTVRRTNSGANSRWVRFMLFDSESADPVSGNVDVSIGENRVMEIPISASGRRTVPLDTTPTYTFIAKEKDYLDEEKHDVVLPLRPNSSDANTTISLEFPMRKPLQTVTVESSIPGLEIAIVGSDPRTTPFDVEVETEKPITLIAPGSIGGDGEVEQVFQQWLVNNRPQIPGESQITFSVDKTTTAIAMYETALFNLRVLSIPFDGVSITSSDANFTGVTPYRKGLNEATTVSLTAPEEKQGSQFVGWIIGEEVAPSIEGRPVTEDTDIIAVYELQWRLQPGWNLISAPFDLDQPTRARLADILNERTFWEWEDGRFQHIETIQPRFGFWVHTTRERAIKPEASLETAKNARVVEPDLTPGWNLFGIGGQHPVARKDVTGATGTIWAWDCSGQRFIDIDDTAQSSIEQGILFPGHAYWFYKKP